MPSQQDNTHDPDKDDDADEDDNVDLESPPCSFCSQK